MAEDRWPKLYGENDPGYSTLGKQGADYKIRIVLDYSNVNESIASAKRSLENMERAFAANSSVKGRNYSFNVSDAGAFRYKAILPGDGRQMRESLAQSMTELGKFGKTTMSNYVNRIETGRMKGSVRYTTRGDDKRYVVEVGWIRLWYKYFGFQEMGTSKIRPMNSVMKTAAQMKPKLDAYLAKFLNTYRRSSGGGAKFK